MDSSIELFEEDFDVFCINRYQDVKKWNINFIFIKIILLIFKKRIILVKQF